MLNRMKEYSDYERSVINIFLWILILLYILLNLFLKYNINKSDMF